MTDRTGHKSSQMLSLYTRQARTWAELALGPLRPLDELLPEMKPSTPAVVETTTGEADMPLPQPELAGESLGHEWAASGSDCWTRTSDPAVNRRARESALHVGPENKPDREMRSGEIASVRGGRAQFMPNGGAVDPLERALLLAAEAGQFGVVAQLAKELEARRLASSGNVVSIGTPRRERVRPHDD